MEMYDNPSHVASTFNEQNLSEYLLQAQWAEFIALKEEIHQLSTQLQRPISILDIGIGDARIPKHLSGIKEIWDQVSSYDGIDIAQNCVDLSLEWIKTDLNAYKVTATRLDATQLASLAKSYDLIICTWFTAGNFYPETLSLNPFVHGQSLETNAKFSSIFKQAFAALNPKGKIVIGSIYIDNETTRKIQEASYRHFNWHIITDERDSFTATQEGWWSQRFTTEMVYRYLDFVPKENIKFKSLDTYEFAMLVEIEKY